MLFYVASRGWSNFEGNKHLTRVLQKSVDGATERGASKPTSKAAGSPSHAVLLDHPTSGALWRSSSKSDPPTPGRRESDAPNTGAMANVGACRCACRNQSFCLGSAPCHDQSLLLGQCPGAAFAVQPRVLKERRVKQRQPHVKQRSGRPKACARGRLCARDRNSTEKRSRSIMGAFRTTGRTPKQQNSRGAGVRHALRGSLEIVPGAMETPEIRKDRGLYQGANNSPNLFTFTMEEQV